MPDEPKIEAEAPEKPEYLLDKFQSESDQARAYAELEKETGRLRTELGRERENFAASLQRIEAQAADKPAPYNPSQDPLVAQYGAAIEAGDYAQAMMIQAAVNQQAVTQVIDKKFDEFKPALSAQEQSQREVAFTMAQTRMAKEYGDRWETDLQPQVYKMLQERPHWLPQTATVDGYATVLKEAAEVVDSARILKEAEVAERDRVAKLNAQTMSGDTSRAPLSPDAQAAAERTWQEVKDAKTGDYTNLIR